MSTPQPADHGQANAALVEAYRLLVEIARRYRESQHPDNAKDEQADERAA